MRSLSAVAICSRFCNTASARVSDKLKHIGHFTGMSRNKCLRCGVVNVATDKACRRCGSLLNGTDSAEGDLPGEPAKRGVGRRLLWIAGTTTLLLFIAYMSL